MTESRRSLARAAKQSHALPEHAACSECGERDIRTLIPRGDTVLCQACDNRRRGWPDTQQHHFAGQHNSDCRVLLDANEHRIVTDLQVDWGTPRMENTEKNLFIVVVNVIQGAFETGLVLFERALRYVKALPALNEDLVELLGPQWWKRCRRFIAAIDGDGE